MEISMKSMQLISFHVVPKKAHPTTTTKMNHPTEMNSNANFDLLVSRERNCKMQSGKNPFLAH